MNVLLGLLLVAAVTALAGGVGLVLWRKALGPAHPHEPCNDHSCRVCIFTKPPVTDSLPPTPAPEPTPVPVVAELLFTDHAGIEVRVGELDPRADRALLQMDKARAILVLNGLPIAVFVEPRTARAFGCFFEAFRMLGRLHDAVETTAQSASREEGLTNARQLNAVMGDVRTGMAKFEACSTGEVPGRVTQ